MITFLLFALFVPQPTFDYKWKPDTHVQVYFMAGAFTPSQVKSAMRGLNSWQVAGITYTLAGDTSESLTCADCLTFRRANLTDKREVGQLSAWHYDSHWIAYAWVDIDFRSVAPEMIQAISAHEGGHLLSLADGGGRVRLFGIYRSDSVMDYFGGMNKWGRIEPSAKDLEAARAVYR